MTSRPSGESPRVFATTPRYFDGNGHFASANGVEGDSVKQNGNSSDHVN